ncbi:MAG: SufE family protein [Pseudomonadota bacterium]|nr:SufE family protein [Pseudomonadota bacterium]
MTESLEDIVETFALLDDWEERYRYLIELGDALPAFPIDKMTDTYKVSGCTSRVWMLVEPVAGVQTRLDITATSDARIVRGLVAVILAAYSRRTPDEILALDIKALFEKLGLDDHLSPNRRSGFFSMVEKVRTLATAARCVTAT